MADENVKHVEVGGKKYALARMSAFDAVHYTLRIAETLKKHGINQVESILEISGKIFGILNRADHDELLFTLLEQSRAQDVESGKFIRSWDEANLLFTPNTIGDIYLVALECLRFSIMPVADGLKKNIGLDTASPVQGMLELLLKTLLKNLTEKSTQN